MANNKHQKILDTLEMGETYPFALSERSKVACCISKYFHADRDLTVPFGTLKRFTTKANNTLNIVMVKREK